MLLKMNSNSSRKYKNSFSFYEFKEVKSECFNLLNSESNPTVLCERT
ncbi:hypothetical protein FCR2A7T_19180 [Flavobacterium cauense R2A-7]|nr:hypothetical protein FCR2A7T_19180 [Flavobacterium cauense R2A-7]